MTQMTCSSYVSWNLRTTSSENLNPRLQLPPALAVHLLYHLQDLLGNHGIPNWLRKLAAKCGAGSLSACLFHQLKLGKRMNTGTFFCQRCERIAKISQPPNLGIWTGAKGIQLKVGPSLEAPKSTQCASVHQAKDCRTPHWNYTFHRNNHFRLSYVQIGLKMGITDYFISRFPKIGAPPVIILIFMGFSLK